MRPGITRNPIGPPLRQAESMRIWRSRVHRNFEDEARELLMQASALNKGDIMTHSALILLNYELNQPVDPAWYDEIFYRLSNYPVIPTTLISLRAFTKCSEKECGVPAETLEKMFNLMMDNETTGLSNKRLAEAEATLWFFHNSTPGKTSLQGTPFIHPGGCTQPPGMPHTGKT